jgi:hypothetical protein
MLLILLSLPPPLSSLLSITPFPTPSTHSQALAERFQATLQRNAQLPELERLARDEFIVDEAEVARLKCVGDCFRMREIEKNVAEI